MFANITFDAYFANSAFTTIVVTFIYSAYFAKGIMDNEGMGQVYWGNTITICAIIIAILLVAYALSSFFLH